MTQFQSIISQIDSVSIFVIDTVFAKKDYVPLDLSKDNLELKAVDVASSGSLGIFVDQQIKSKNGKIAYGGYLETRGIYQRSEHFNIESSPQDERNIHLGVDIWANVGTIVLATLDSEVHSFSNNLNHGDYGPTIILKHQIDDFTFYTLYGHLSLASLSGLEIGMQFKQGETIAQLGSAEVNGDYPPHLHFQIIIDIENYSGDYPGVSSINNLGFYRANCPDPNLLLNLGGRIN
ncbi:MAG: peptidoglycan DD-metalloendopeptidase family protein [Crocinitomicaceae bacterium]